MDEEKTAPEGAVFYGIQFRLQLLASVVVGSTGIEPVTPAV
ncbi:hypothetical protein [Caballeronia sp. LZ001]|nr:hypothetical protein [Caballeronia sp. LZ001]MDR5804419.1 hypothetical protein [Caballeronia sp. LZ001]